MRVGLLVVACAGCNGVFGIGGDIQLTDAAYFDAPTRIPTCPPLGGLPAFGEAVNEVTEAAGCHTYSVATDGTQMAVCTSGMANAVWVAEPNGALAPLDLATPHIGIYDARLSGDGSLAVIQMSTTSGQAVIALHHDQLAHTWTAITGTLPTTSGTFASPSSGPPYRLIYFYNDADVGYSLYELTGDGATWSPIASYPTPGTLTMLTASMTPDGLHLVGVANTLTGGHIVYADRATTADPFSTFRTLDTVPNMIFDPFLTADCARLYFTALGRVLYLEQ